MRYLCDAIYQGKMNTFDDVNKTYILVNTLSVFFIPENVFLSFKSHKLFL